MKQLLSIYLIICTLSLSSQTGVSVSGFVTDANGQKSAYTTVQLIPTGRVTISNEQGFFEFRQVPSGNYEIRLSSVGFQPLERKITVGDSPIILKDLKLLEATGQLEQVVVTASRMAQSLGDVPIPITVIDNDQITGSGNVRLDEILIEQTGLNINSDHGIGIQIQGLNSEYILILIDGEPLIGRTAGTLDLSRVTVNNIDRVEIIKGPSSSLYGSEAMGGVINIITKNPASGFGVTLGAKYRRFNSSDLNANIEYARERLQLNAFLNRLKSAGYDLNESTINQTVSAFTATTAQIKAKYNLTNDLNLSLSGRYYEEPQSDQTMVSISNGQTSNEVLHDYKAKRTDWNLLPKLEWRPSENSLFTLRQYISKYETETRITRESDNDLFSLDQFEQTFSRTEGQADLFINPKHTLTLGAGYIQEGVSSTRYVDSTFTSGYFFAQHLWQPTDHLDFTLGLRYDDHEAYGNNLSPKLAIGYEVNHKLKLRASFGGGFKAPDFRQLLLDFTNPTVGYSVMGTSVVIDGVERLIDRGETFRTDPINNPDAIESARANALVSANGLNAERSIAWNLGLDYQINERVLITGNLFRNNISNLIDTWAIAQKDNGQFVFSYRNVEDIVTQGIELETSFQALADLRISLGYQFLDTFDRAVIDEIETGSLAYRPAGEIVSRRVDRSDYGGLFGRSKHSGNVKVSYNLEPLRLGIYLRSVYRGRWGFGDRDGNQILVGDSEYAKGYFQHNLSFQKQFGKSWTADAGVNNLLGTTSEFEASLPGRIWFAGLKFQLRKNDNQ